MKQELYREYSPHPLLAPYVQCFWSIGAVSLPLINHVLPDGCVDLLVEKKAESSAVWIVGAMSTSALVPLDENTEFLGVRFRPGGALPFLRVGMNELTNEMFSLNDFDLRRQVSLDEEFFEMSSLAQRMAFLENSLIKLVDSLSPVDTITGCAIRQLKKTKGLSTIESLKEALEVSERQLERRFLTNTGVTPKAFSRMVRFREAAKRLQIGELGSFPDLALDLGYYDQAHFIRDFRTHCGMTPKEFRNQQRDAGFLQYRL